MHPTLFALFGFGIFSTELGTTLSKLGAYFSISFSPSLVNMVGLYIGIGGLVAWALMLVSNWIEDHRCRTLANKSTMQPN